MKRSDFLDLDELAARWDVHRDSASRKARRLKLRPHRLGTDRRVTFYTLADVHRAETDITL